MTFSEWLLGRQMDPTTMTVAQRAALFPAYQQSIGAAPDVESPTPSYMSGVGMVYGSGVRSALESAGSSIAGALGVGLTVAKVIAVGAVVIGGIALYRYVRGK